MIQKNAAKAVLQAEGPTQPTNNVRTNNNGHLAKEPHRWHNQNWHVFRFMLNLGTQTSASKYPIYGIDEPLALVIFHLKSDMLLSSGLGSIELKQVSLMVVMSDPLSMSAGIDWPSIITVDSFVRPIILTMRVIFSLE